MLKRMGMLAGSAAAGLLLLGGVASADSVLPVELDDQAGLANLDVLHNVNLVGGVCDNNVNVLGVQVPVRDVANGIGVPVLSPGQTDATGQNPFNCAGGGIEDGGTSQEN